MRLREIQQNLDKKFSSNINKIALLVEQFADQVVRPAIQAMGLRLAKLARTYIEVVVPDKLRNQDVNGHIDEGVLMSAALWAFRTLWSRNAPTGHFEIHIGKVTFEKIKPCKGELRLRGELDEMTREALYAEMNQAKKADQESVLSVFDIDEQRVAQVYVWAQLSKVEMLEWK